MTAPAMVSGNRVHDYCERHFLTLAILVLLLAGLNTFYRLGAESVTEWDESLYAVSAAEVLSSGQWLDTTFWGIRDYYNSKPPLNIWLIATAFKLFGTNLVALRLTSALSAWTTIAVLITWARRRTDAVTALVAGLVLSTCFGFLYVHSARTANTDPLFTLLILVTVVILSMSQRRSSWFVLLGPVMAAVFLLRGMAVLMPLLIVILVEIRRPPSRGHWRMRSIAALSFAALISIWIFKRWQIDGGRFFEALLTNDFVSVALTVMEQHGGGPLFYVNVLQRYQYEWLIVAAAAWCLLPRQRSVIPTREMHSAGVPNPRWLLWMWGLVTFMVPTLMQTKTSWYLNPFYPVFALIVAWSVGRLLRAKDAPSWRAAVLAVLLVVALGVAEAKLIWRTLQHRDLAQSAQGLLLENQAVLAEHTVYRDHWNHDERFVLEKMVGARGHVAPTLDDFLRMSEPGDFLLSRSAVTSTTLTEVGANARHTLYKRVR